MRITVKQLKNLIREAIDQNLMETDNYLEGMTITDMEELPMDDPRVARFLRSPAAKEYLRQNPDADIINPGPEKADFVKFARDFDASEERRSAEQFRNLPGRRRGGLFAPMRPGEPTALDRTRGSGPDPVAAHFGLDEAYVRRIVRNELKKYR